MIAMPNATSLTLSRSPAPPVFRGLVRVEDYAFRARTGFTARLGLPDVAPAAPHPFAGSQTGFAFGRRLVCRLADIQGASLFSGDAILLWWGDDSRHGKRIEIVLDGDPYAPHPLASCAVGKRDGDVLVATFEDAPDEHPVPRNGLLVRKRLFALAHTLPQKPAFQTWFRTHIDAETGASAEEVANALRLHCGISSRRELLLDTPNAEQARGRLRAVAAAFAASGSWEV